MDRHGNPQFYKLLEEMADIHDKKSHDYASDENPSGNYHFAGSLAKLFNDHHDAGFVGRIGEKIYRLANLENSGKSVKNESIEDTEQDIAVITCLWMADRRDRRAKENTAGMMEEGTYDIGERYPGPPNALGCDERGIKIGAIGKSAFLPDQPAAPDYDSILRTMLQLNDSILNYLKR